MRISANDASSFPRGRVAAIVPSIPTCSFRLASSTKSMNHTELTVDQTDRIDSGPNLGGNGGPRVADVQSHRRISCRNVGESVRHDEGAGANGGNGEGG